MTTEAGRHCPGCAGWVLVGMYNRTECPGAEAEASRATLDTIEAAVRGLETPRDTEGAEMVGTVGRSDVLAVIQKQREGGA